MRQPLLLFSVFLLCLAFPAAQGLAVNNPAVTAGEIMTPADTAPAAGGDVAPSSPDIHAESKGGGLPQLNIATWPSQIFWLLVMFAVLYTAFSRKILPDIGGVVEGREAAIRADLDSARALKEQAEAMQAAYEKNLDQARKHAVQAVQEVEQAAKARAAEQMDALRRRGETDIRAAEENVGIAKQRAMAEMSDVAADVAAMAAEKITGRATDRQKVQAIVESLSAKAKAA